jgi:hypothetical protein
MAVEDRWAPTAPTVDDPFPLTDVVSPPVADDVSPSRMPLWLPGGLMIVAATWLLARTRRPREAVHG